MKKQTITPASAWKARATGEIVELPSGATVRIRRPSLFALARTGNIPNPLAAAVIRYLAVTDETEIVTPDQQARSYQENATVYASIAAVSLTEPRVILDRIPDYDGGEIAPEDLSTVDLIYIYNYVMGVVIDETANFPADDPSAGESISGTVQQPA
jgi:hypothetical protein